MRLEPLAELRLHYTTPVWIVRPFQAETSPGSGAGYGEGSGRIDGPGLSGVIRWANHPRARADGAMLPDTDGVIETDDAAIVLLHLSGLTTFDERDVGRQLLRVGFEAADARYRWLNDVFAVAEGVIEHDPDTDRWIMRAPVYRVVHELAPRDSS